MKNNQQQQQQKQPNFLQQQISLLNQFQIPNTNINSNNLSQNQQDTFLLQQKLQLQQQLYQQLQNSQPQSFDINEQITLLAKQNNNNLQQKEPQLKIEQQLTKQEIKIKCQIHPQNEISQICNEVSCQVNKIGCNLCMQQYHMSHSKLPLEQFIQDLIYLQERTQNLQTTESLQWERIQKTLSINLKQLKDLEELTKKLQNNIIEIQNTMEIVQKETSQKPAQILQQILEFKNIANSQNLQQNQHQELIQLYTSIQKFQYKPIQTYPQIVEILELNEQLNQYSENYLKDFSFYILKTSQAQNGVKNTFGTFNYEQDINKLNNLEQQQYIKQKNNEQQQQQPNQLQQTNSNTNISSNNNLNKKTDENENSKLVSQLAQIFHCSKGQAKKRDIINFLTLNENKQEIKFTKDIKEKEEKSHYQLVFMLQLKNLDVLQVNQINNDLINWLKKLIIEVYPVVRKEKEEQRKSGSLKQGNKRRYCKLDFKYEIDIKNYLLTPTPIPADYNMYI